MSSIRSRRSKSTSNVKKSNNSKSIKKKYDTDNDEHNNNNDDDDDENQSNISDNKNRKGSSRRNAKSNTNLIKKKGINKKKNDDDNKEEEEGKLKDKSDDNGKNPPSIPIRKRRSSVRKRKRLNRYKKVDKENSNEKSDNEDNYDEENSNEKSDDSENDIGNKADESNDEECSNDIAEESGKSNVEDKRTADLQQKKKKKKVNKKHIGKRVTNKKEEDNNNKEEEDNNKEEEDNNKEENNNNNNNKEEDKNNNNKEEDNNKEEEDNKDDEDNNNKENAITEDACNSSIENKGKNFESTQNDSSMIKDEKNDIYKDELKSIKCKENKLYEYSDEELSFTQSFDSSFSSSNTQIDDFKPYINVNLSHLKCKFNHDDTSLSKFDINTFYAFFGAHHQLFFEIAYFLTCYYNPSVVLASKNELENQNSCDFVHSPLIKYEIKDKSSEKNVNSNKKINGANDNIEKEIETEIRISDLIDCICQKYGIQACSPNNYEESILKYINIMKSIYSDLLYCDIIYKDCSIIDAIKTDLKESDMIPRYVVVKVDGIVPQNVDIEIDVENHTNKPLNNKIKLIYKIAWAIDDDGSIVTDDDYFRSMNDEFVILKKESVEEIFSKLKLLYACYLIYKIN